MAISCLTSGPASIKKLSELFTRYSETGNRNKGTFQQEVVAWK